jgi:lipid-binding SYLF domain-containing protein
MPFSRRFRLFFPPFLGLPFLWIVILGIAVSAGFPPETEAQAGPPSREELRLLNASAGALRILRSAPENRPLDFLLSKARGVMVFPRVIKAGLIFGAEGGNGAMAARLPDGAWSAPVFFALGGASIGVQLGVQRATLILVLMDDESVAGAMGKDFMLGADVTLAAGKALATAEVSTASASPDVYFFSSTEGLFLGAGLNGKVLNLDGGANAAFYGEDISPREVLFEGKHREASGANILRDALSERRKTGGRSQ